MIQMDLGLYLSVNDDIKGVYINSSDFFFHFDKELEHGKQKAYI